MAKKVNRYQQGLRTVHKKNREAEEARLIRERADAYNETHGFVQKTPENYYEQMLQKWLYAGLTSFERSS